MSKQNIRSLILSGWVSVPSEGGTIVFTWEMVDSSGRSFLSLRSFGLNAALWLMLFSTHSIAERENGAIEMELEPGIEPGTSSLPWMRSSQLSYSSSRTYLFLVIGSARASKKTCTKAIDILLGVVVQGTGFEPV